MIKKIFACFLCFYCFAFSSARSEELRIFIEPNTAESVIKSFFGTMASDGWVNFEGDAKDAKVVDAIIFHKVLLEYYNILIKSLSGNPETAYLITVEDIWNMCQVLFRSQTIEDYRKNGYVIKPTYKSGEGQYCSGFARALIRWQIKPNYGASCEYKVSKHNGKQTQIKYEAVNGTGFIRKNGTIAWRFFNPGNLRRSSLACGRIDTNPSGTFAVFSSYETGRQALLELLRGQMYGKLTIDKAISKYAPSSDNNNTNGYIRHVKQGLKAAGVRNVDTVTLNELSDSEINILMDTIERIEGWTRAGSVENFGAQNVVGGAQNVVVGVPLGSW